jgi:hypothetical protein
MRKKRNAEREEEKEQKRKKKEKEKEGEDRSKRRKAKEKMADEPHPEEQKKGLIVHKAADSVVMHRGGWKSEVDVIYINQHTYVFPVSSAGRVAFRGTEVHVGFSAASIANTAQHKLVLRTSAGCKKNHAHIYHNKSIKQAASPCSRLSLDIRLLACA